MPRPAVLVLDVNETPSDLGRCGNAFSRSACLRALGGEALLLCPMYAHIPPAVDQ
jgi:hypothetical protein